MEGYLLVNESHCCGYSLTIEESTWFNLTQTLLSLAQQSNSKAWLTCQEGAPRSDQLDFNDTAIGSRLAVAGYGNSSVTVYDLSSVTTRLQSREEFLQERLGERHISLEAVVLLTALYTLIFLSGVLGNGCTCIVIARNRSMHTATNYYLFSLAVSDVLTLLLGE